MHAASDEPAVGGPPTPPARLGPEVVVVVPVHNEAAVLGATLDDLHRRFTTVVCIDDGSSDGSAAVARAHGAHVVRHTLNLGQGAALQTGLTFALLTLASLRPTEIVTFDADGQHDPDDAARMVEVARRTGVDVVLGSRFLGSSERASVPALRRGLLRAGVAFTRATTRLAVTDTHNGLRVLTADAAARLQLRLRGMAHASELLSRIGSLGLTYVEVPVSIRYTDYSVAKGQSSLNAVNIVFDLAVQRLYATR